MYNNNIRTDSEIHKFINSEFRNHRLRLEWPLLQDDFADTYQRKSVEPV